jgi:hypothetical protein
MKKTPPAPPDRLRRLEPAQGSGGRFPRGRQPPGTLRGRVPGRRDQFLLLPAAPAPDLRALGRQRAARFPLRRQAAARDHARGPPARHRRAARPLRRRGRPPGRKLGCVLVQLPPKGVFDEDRRATSCRACSERFGCMLACEARHPSWFSDAATELLREHGVTRVIADPPPASPVRTCRPRTPATSACTARRALYYSRYPPEVPARSSARIATPDGGGADCWCIFDNTAAFAAVPNALEVLRALAARWHDRIRPWSAPPSASTTN